MKFLSRGLNSKIKSYETKPKINKNASYKGSWKIKALTWEWPSEFFTIFTLLTNSFQLASSFYVVCCTFSLKCFEARGKCWECMRERSVILILYFCNFNLILRDYNYWFATIFAIAYQFAVVASGLYLFPYIM